MKIKILVTIGIGVMMMLGNGLYSEQTAQANDMATAVKGNTAFAWNLYAQLKAEEGNLFYSPYSISTALAMTYAGARGKTAEQMADVLHFSLGQETLHPAFLSLTEHFEEITSSGKVSLNLANSMWVDYTVKLLERFREITHINYGANLFQVDFVKAWEACRQQINEWVAEKTHKKIKELLQQGDVDSETTLVLTNAIYFNGSWLHPFDEEKTNEAPFWTSPESSVTVPMMNQLGSFEYAEEENLQIVALPYEGEQLYMVILLPWEKDGLPKLEAQLNTETMMQWLTRVNPRKISVSLPKFTMRSRFYLLETLQQMGMADLSDFSGISNPSLPLTKVIHEAFVDVNEKGTEAAAATAVTFGRSMPMSFEANHPFVFFIFDVSSKVYYLSDG